jgi:hypothetical protein
MKTPSPLMPCVIDITRVGLLLAILPLAVFASTIQVTVTGTVLSGDSSGVFGPPSTDLTGSAYDLVFTFDDSLGVQTRATCNGTPYFVAIDSTATSNPGTATLSINGGSFTFGVLNAQSQFESEARKLDPCDDDEISLSAGDGHFGDGSGISGSVDAASRTTFGANAGWAAPFSDSNLEGGESFGFEISEYDTTGQSGHGQLNAQTITVSGLDVSAPEPGSLILGVAAISLLILSSALYRRST